MLIKRPVADEVLQKPENSDKKSSQNVNQEKNSAGSYVPAARRASVRSRQSQQPNSPGNMQLLVPPQ